MNQTSHFDVLDYAILAITSIASLGIGFYFACTGKKQTTTEEYFKGNSKMKMLPIVMSIMATIIRSNTMLGIPTEVYYYGFNYCYTILGIFIGCPIASYGFMPVFYKLQLTSVCEYTQHRFNKHIRTCTSLMFIFTMLIMSSFATYTPALALSQATGLSVWTSVLATTVISTIYTSIGGIKAVVWTDCLQLLILTCALVATIINGCIYLDGISFIVNKSLEGHRLSTLSFNPDPTIRFNFWNLIIFSTIQCTFIFGVTQLQVQRYVCCSNQKSAHRSIWINLFGYVTVSIIYCFIGLMIYAMFWNCDPLSSQQIEKHDQLLPLFVINAMHSIPGMTGLFVAGVYSAALSTLSSSLNSLTALTLVDHIKPRWTKLSDQKATFLSKFIAVGYGILSLLVIAAIINLGSVVQTSQYLMGGIVGANLGLFFLGLMNPWANSKGTVVGIICGLGLSWWISLGNQIYHPISDSLLRISTENCSDIIGNWTILPELVNNRDDIPEIYKISYLWITPISFTVTVIVGSICSLVTSSNKVLNMNLLSPFVHSIMKKYFCKKYDELQRKNQTGSSSDNMIIINS